MFMLCETICAGVHVYVHRSMNVVQIPYSRTFWEWLYFTSGVF